LTDADDAPPSSPAQDTAPTLDLTAPPGTTETGPEPSDEEEDDAPALEPRVQVKPAEDSDNNDDDDDPPDPPELVATATANALEADAGAPQQELPGILPPEVGADLPGYIITPADALLNSVYGDHVHPNDGTHLDGACQTDRLWQRLWLRMVQLAPTRYAVPKGAVGRRFLHRLTLEFQGVRKRTWNCEHPLVFAAVILQTTPGVCRAKDIRRRLASRMDLWDQGRFVALVDDTERELRTRTGTDVRPDEETRARAFNSRVLSGRLRSACRTLTCRDGGGVLQPDDLCTKAGRPVLDVLREKHPDLRDPVVGQQGGSFESYEDIGTAIPTDVRSRSWSRWPQDCLAPPAPVAQTLSTSETGSSGSGPFRSASGRRWASGSTGWPTRTLPGPPTGR
jgi:hypothetical protein